MGGKDSEKKPRYRLLPRTIIQGATRGDADAIAAVLQRYEGYIAKLCTLVCYDENGIGHSYVDEEMQDILKEKLMLGIQTFEVE